MTQKKTVTRRKGGRRPGSGRKPSSATVARRVMEENNVTIAQEAFDLLVEFMRDEDAPRRLRLDCAMYLQDRVWGKPTVSVRDDPDLPMLVDDLPEPLPRPRPAVVKANGHG